MTGRPRETAARRLFRIGVTLAWPAAAILLLALAGCARDAESADENTLKTAAERGPLQLAVSARPKEILVGDSVRLDIRFQTPEGYDVAFPEWEATDAYDILDVTEPPSRPTADGNAIVRRQTVEIEPLFSGSCAIGPVVVKYRKTPGTAGELTSSFTQELGTETLEINVSSVLAAEDRVDQPRDITSALLPPKPPRPWWHWAVLAGAGLAALGLIAGVVVWIRRWASRPPAPIAPEVWALRELGALERERLPARGDWRLFYYRLSEVVRGYIERKFAVRAPEMTTEEFLVSLTRERSVLAGEEGRLRAFLETCDMVKYAALEPGETEAEEGLRTARAFVNESAAAFERAQRTMAEQPAGQGGQAA